MWIAVFSPDILRGAVHGSPAGVLEERSPEGRFCKSLEHTKATALGRLCAELQGATSSPHVFNAGMRYLVLQSWEKFAEASDEPTYHALHPAVENALSFLRRGESEESLVELSKHARLSPARLSRAFKEQVGLGIAEYRNRMRLERFLEAYGKQRRITALAAALEAGFNSYAQFYRVFCRLMGFSPSEYRRRAAIKR
jgi:AraC-like DNA-binding protein